ncbi:MAG: beta strand repeat-containing protein, partial [Spartobacteria bacterium]
LTSSLMGSNSVLTLSGSNTFTGRVEINNGIVIANTIKNFGTDSSLGRGTSNSAITIGQTAGSGTLRYIGSGDTANRIFQIGVNSGTPGVGDTGGATIENAGSGALVLNAPIFNNQTGATNGAGADRTLTLRGTNTNANTISGIIRDNIVSNTATGTARIGLIKTDTGKWILGGTNTYTGSTVISNGTLQIGNGTDAGSIATTVAITNNGALVFNVGAGVRALAAPISGTGSLAQDSAGGSLTLSGTNTYTGSTTVSTGTLTLATNGSMLFVIGGSGTNNGISGTGTTVMNGKFAFDLTSASTNTNATWTVVANTLTNSYGTNFIVTGFSGAGGNWTNTTNGVNYVFAQSTGVLSVQSTGSVTPYNAWVSYWQGIDSSFTNTAGTNNPDGDPFNNNMEFAFDGNPTIGSPALLTATNVGTDAVFNYVALTNTNAATYQVQNTTNLASGPWTNSTVTISNSTNQSGISQPNNYVRKEFVVPGTGSSFYRVQATIAP